MRQAIGLLAIPFLALIARADPKPSPQIPPIDPAALDATASLLAPIQIDSLTLTPIVATPGTAKADPDVLVLDQAFAQKLIKIKEQDSESVNSLTLSNSADRPLFLLAGEVIIGGKQDRIIGRNTVIPANTTQDVPVFCVEHGRWNGTTAQFTSAKALAHGRLRGKASYAAQQDVWDEVAVKNQERKTTSASDTYRKVAQQQSDGTLSAMERRVDAALAKLSAADRGRMVGYAVAINGAVATVDVFGSPALFKKLETKLVRSYLTEAVDVAARKGAVPPSPADVRSFMADADKAAAQRSYDTAAAETVINNGSYASKAKVDYKRTRPAAGAAPAVYENYQAR